MTKLQIPAAPAWLNAKTAARAVGVDREKNVLRGYVVAQLGPFKSEGRGEFDRAALERIVELGNAKRAGLRSRFTHPDLSSDGLGKFLGRSVGLSIDRALDARTGQAVDAVRADLVFDPTALEPPPDGGGTPLGKYVMDLAESDPDALSSSLVLQMDTEYRLNPDGTRKTDADGNPLPPLWRPTDLLASDIVDTGDAVDGLLSAGLSAGELPDGAVRLAADLLDRTFAGASREVVKARCLSYLDRYLTRRFGEPEAVALTDDLRRRLQLKEKSRV